MNNGRDTILRTIRDAVDAGNRGTAPTHPPRNGVGRQGGGVDPVERFCQEFAAAGGTSHRAADSTAAVDIVLSLVRQTGAKRILLGGATIASLKLEDALRRDGMEIIRSEEGDKEDYFAADVGVSGVDYLIAETGSIVMLTRPEQPRALSLLPPVHIAVARREQIVADLFDLFEEQLRAGGEPLPACVSIITGPSKTGDIELKLVTGVHGPGEVHVVILE